MLINLPPTNSNVTVLFFALFDAPKYAELNPSIVNPIAMILSACMMLDHIGEEDKATKKGGKNCNCW